MAEMINSKKLFDEVKTRDMVINRQDNAPARSDSGYDAHSDEGDGDRSDGESSFSDQPLFVNSVENNIEDRPD